MERLRRSVSAPIQPFPVYRQLSNQVTDGEEIEYDWNWGGHPVLGIVNNLV